jgi:hypothetical protein
VQSASRFELHGDLQLQLRDTTMCVGFQSLDPGIGCVGVTATVDDVVAGQHYEECAVGGSARAHMVWQYDVQGRQLRHLGVWTVD